MSDKRSRGWCFTLNNYTEDNVTFCQKIDARYICFGKEVGQSGTKHLQGYLYFDDAKSFKAVKKILPDGCHIEYAKGDGEQNKKYCGKEGDLFEKGDCPKSKKAQGEAEKERWQRAKELAIKGELDDIDADIFLRCYRTLKDVKKDYMIQAKDAESVTGIWIYGAAGVGKSRYARDVYGKDCYLKGCNKWWDGYRNQKYVIIDDFDKGHSVLSHYIKIWSDRYAFLAESNGSAMNIRPRHVIVTSQYCIEDIWLDVETRDALRRRFKVIEIKGDGSHNVNLPSGYVEEENTQ